MTKDRGGHNLSFCYGRSLGWFGRLSIRSFKSSPHDRGIAIGVGVLRHGYATPMSILLKSGQGPLGVCQACHQMSVARLQFITDEAGSTACKLFWGVRTTTLERLNPVVPQQLTTAAVVLFWAP